MNGNSELKEVRFDKWCKTCKHQDKKLGEPCESCLEIGMREGTYKPEYWEEK